MKAKLPHTNRSTTYPINELILNRWSPRAMSAEPISHEQLYTLFEAARWAPSSYNNQPWKFIYAQRTDPEWNSFLELLVPFNKEWAQHAAVLMIIASDTLFAYNKKPSRTHAFDTGAAWQNMALQASSMGLIAHGMEGFNYTKAAGLAQLPETFQVHAMCAIGLPGDKNNLSQEMREKEKPSERNGIESFAFKGNFKG